MSPSTTVAVPIGSKRFILLASMLLFVGLLSIGLPSASTLAAGTEARLMPISQNINVNAQTTVTLRLENVQDLYGYQTAIVFNPSVLEVVDADPGQSGIQVELGTFVKPDFSPQNNADNSVGAIVCVVSQLNPTPPVSGSGTLLTITFRGKAQGVSDVRFTELKLAKSDGSQIAVTRYDASVTVGNVTVTPTSTAPTSTPTATTTPWTPTPTPTFTTTPWTPTPTATPTPAPGQQIIYVVRTGDTLYSIARRFGVTLQALMQVNGIYNPNYIQVGQHLIIPRCCVTTTPYPPTPQPCSITYIVKPGDTLYSLALRYGTTVQAIAQWNNIVNPSRIYAGQRLVIQTCAPVPPPPPTCGIHIVQRGETLYSLARRYGTTVWTLAMLNNLHNPNVIYAGQRLVLPC